MLNKKDDEYDSAQLDHALETRAGETQAGLGAGFGGGLSCLFDQEM